MEFACLPTKLPYCKEETCLSYFSNQICRPWIFVYSKKFVFYFILKLEFVIHTPQFVT